MKTRGLTSFQLKLMMAFLMVFDHLDIIPNLLSDNWIIFFHLLTRCVAVWFGFAAVEGFLYTRNRKAYLCRLFFGAGVMFLGNSLLNFILHSKGIHIANNIFLTLASGILILTVFFDQVEGKKKTLAHFIFGGLLTLLAMVMTEGGTVLIPFMLISYLLRDKKKLRNVMYLMLSGILFFSSIQIYPNFYDTLGMILYNSDWLFITVLPFLGLYNNKRGLTTKWSKYFFYIFYPLHLWIIVIIAVLASK